MGLFLDIFFHTFLQTFLTLYGTLFTLFYTLFYTFRDTDELSLFLLSIIKAKLGQIIMNLPVFAIDSPDHDEIKEGKFRGHCSSLEASQQSRLKIEL